MEIFHLINNTYQVVDLSTNSVLFQGTHEECVHYQEDALYEMFLSMAGF
jgi:hypothetical protein